jgi:spore maturation protein CgeB
VRLLIVDTCYPAFLDAHYARSPALATASYDEQWAALMRTFFGTGDAYSHFLGEIGHAAHEVVVNCQPLQEAWSREHPASRWHLGRRRGELVLRQAEWFKPDVVYVQNLSTLPPATLRALRARARLLVGQIASEPPGREQLEPFDLILTSFPHFVPRFRELGIDSEYFRIGFDPRVLGHLDSAVEAADVVFAGTLRPGQHQRGNELLAAAAERVPIDFWGIGVEDWPESSAIRRRYRGEAWGIDMLRVLHRAKIALNRHIDVAEDHANNMRLYEATGVGTLLLTDAKSDLRTLFEPGTEVVAYANEDELVDAVHHYLANERERIEIARAGQARTLSEHSYADRMKELVAILARRLT